MSAKGKRKLVKFESAILRVVVFLVPCKDAFWNTYILSVYLTQCHCKNMQVGRNYLASGWKQELITISQLLERIQSNEHSSVGPTYLAQHPLFEQVPFIRLITRTFCYYCLGELNQIFLVDICSSHLM
jgi:hypothetical protein